MVKKLIKKTTRAKKGKEVPINYIFPKDIISRFATNVVIQRIEHEFKISFFELQRPILISEKDIEKAKKTNLVDATCVSSVIVSADRLPKFINVFIEQLKKYEKSMPID